MDQPHSNNNNQIMTNAELNAHSKASSDLTSEVYQEARYRVCTPFLGASRK